MISHYVGVTAICCEMLTHFQMHYAKVLCVLILAMYIKYELYQKKNCTLMLIYQEACLSVFWCFRCLYKWVGCVGVAAEKSFSTARAQPIHVRSHCNNTCIRDVYCVLGLRFPTATQGCVRVGLLLLEQFPSTLSLLWLCCDFFIANKALATKVTNGFKAFNQKQCFVLFMYLK